jgi:hypothetical protein
VTVLLAKRALPRGLDAPPLEVTEELAQLPLGFGQQALDGPSASLNLKKLTKPPGAWRLRTGDWRSIFFPTGDDFLVAAIGLRKDIYERFDRMRLARMGDGVKVIEAAAPAVECAGGPHRARTATQAGRAQQAEPVHRRDAAQCGGRRRRPARLPARHATERRCRLRPGRPCRGRRPRLPARRPMGAPPDASRALRGRRGAVGRGPRDRGGRAPGAVGNARERDRARRDGERRADPQAPGPLYRGVDGLPAPSQRAIANATFNGPARVRGGPGTGKTVVALHRARCSPASVSTTTTRSS